MSGRTNYDIVVKLTADATGADSVIGKLKDTTKAGVQLADTMSQARRSQEEFNQAISRLNTSELKGLSGILSTVIDETAKAGENAEMMVDQLAAVHQKLKDDEAGGTMLGRLKSDLAGAAAEIPGVGKGLAVMTNPMTALASGVVAGGLALAGFIKQGVAFNATVQTAQIGIAAVMMQFDKSGKIATFSQAMERSAEAIELLKQKAAESPATFEQLVSSLQAVSGAATQAGLSMRQQVSFITQMSQTLSGLGIETAQIAQETRALLTGDITEDAAAARMLGIRRQDIELAKQQGKLYEFLMGKTAAFSEAGKAGADTLNNAWTNVYDSLQQLAGAVSKPIFETLTASAVALSKAMAQINIMLGVTNPGLSSAGEAAGKAAPKLQTVKVALYDAASGATKLIEVQKDLKTEEPVTQLEKLTKAADEARDAMRGLAEAELERIDAEAGLALATLNRQEAKAVREAKDAGKTPEEIAAIKAGFDQRRAQISGKAEIAKSTAETKKAQDAENEERGKQQAELANVTDKEKAAADAKKKVEETRAKAQAGGLADDDTAAIANFEAALKNGNATSEQATAAADARKRQAAGTPALGYKSSINQLQRAKEGKMQLLSGNMYKEGLLNQEQVALIIKRAQRTGDWSFVDSNLSETEDQRYLVARAKAGKTWDVTDEQDKAAIAAEAGNEQTSLTAADAALTDHRQKDAAAKDAREKYETPAAKQAREDRAKAAKAKTDAALLKQKTTMTNVASRAEGAAGDVKTTGEDATDAVARKEAAAEKDYIAAELERPDIDPVYRKQLLDRLDGLEDAALERDEKNVPMRELKRKAITAQRATRQVKSERPIVKAEQETAQRNASRDIDLAQGVLDDPTSTGEQRRKATLDKQRATARKQSADRQLQTMADQDARAGARTPEQATRIQEQAEAERTRKGNVDAVVNDGRTLATSAKGYGAVSQAAGRDLAKATEALAKDDATLPELKALADALKSYTETKAGQAQENVSVIQEMRQRLKQLEEGIKKNNEAIKGNRS